MHYTKKITNIGEFSPYQKGRGNVQADYFSAKETLLCPRGSYHLHSMFYSYYELR